MCEEQECSHCVLKKMTTNYNIVWFGTKLYEKLDFTIRGFDENTFESSQSLEFCWDETSWRSWWYHWEERLVGISQVQQGVDFSIFEKIVNAKTTKKNRISWSCLTRDYILDNKVVDKILCTMPMKYDHVLTTIIESPTTQISWL